ncbi:MAG: hypothetical protein HY820_39325 [Acidobacteria bacterium]|nr:hypothetical protein [Acidobacteriota bacterium]
MSLRVLSDKNVPVPLRRLLKGCQIRTAAQESWDTLENRELLATAESSGYEILVTCDQNLHYQQNLKHRRIALVVLGSNIWPAVQTRLSEIQKALDKARHGSFEFIEIRAPVRRRPLPK